MHAKQKKKYEIVWSYGHDWPYDGEIDIIEGANDQNHNIISAHTTKGCAISNTLKSKALGTTRSANCDIGTKNVGCGYDPPVEDASSYGDDFNAAGGGVYAMEWDSEYIKIWHFARSQIPTDIRKKTPTPDNWRSPDAIFGGDSCDVDKYFKGMNLVININFCGDWGGQIWGKSDGCGKYAPTCNEFVAKNPQAFTKAYWDVRYIDAYRKTETAPCYPASGMAVSRIETNATTSTVGTNSTGSLNSTTVVDHDAKFASPSTPGDPLEVDGAALVGCFGSSNGFESFRKVADSRSMTVTRCVELCKGAMFSGTYDSQCFCAAALDAETRAVDGELGACNRPCPGNSTQFCGAPASTPPVTAGAHRTRTMALGLALLMLLFLL
ncbi:hypothetical protein E4U53_003824 [Claviceps sorghi]|nr:hypothetical protein E4U53_003824 [Claviceps sorghi]